MSANQSASRPENALPLYYRVMSVLEGRIRSGQLRPLMQLPSESDLCREFGVSRGTVREALRELVSAGLVDRRHGKGSFVSANPPLRAAPMKYTGLLEDLYDQVRKVQVRSVEIETTVGPPAILAALDLEPGTTITTVSRNRHLDGQPFAYTVNFLPNEIGSRIDPAILRRVPLLRVLEEHLGIEIGSAEQNMQARLADAEAARLLGIPLASPVMFAERLYFTQRGTPLQVAHSLYRADRYQLTVHLKRYRKESEWRWAFQTKSRQGE